jgi:hypothetical protein
MTEELRWEEVRGVPPQCCRSVDMGSYDRTWLQNRIELVFFAVRHNRGPVLGAVCESLAGCL